MEKKYKYPYQRKKAASEASSRYHKKATTSYTIRLNNIKDANVIAHLSTIDAKTDYIRRLIEADINKK